MDLEKKRFSIVTAILVLLAFSLAIFAGSTGLFRHFFTSNGVVYEGLAKGACAVFALAIGAIVFRRLQKNLEGNPRSGPPAVMQPSVALLQEFQEQVSKHLEERFNKEAVVTFVAMITSPARHRVRVVESITLEERVAKQEVTVELRLPVVTDEKGGPRYVPLFSPPKGQLVDNLKITDAGSKPLPDLSFEESTQLVAAGLRLLLIQAMNKPSRSTSSSTPPKLSDKLRALELVLLEQLTRRGTVNPTEVQKITNDALTACRSLLNDDQELRRYVEALSLAYPIVAVVPRASESSDRVMLRYERTLIPAALNKRELGLLRVILGLRPNKIVAPADLALTAGSFHMYVVGPPTMYVLEQKFRCRHCEERVSRQWEVREPTDENPCWHKMGTASTVAQSNEDRQYRVSARRGQSFVHLYTRGFGNLTKSQFRDLEFAAELKETPPGSRASAVVTAIVATFLIAIMGRLVSSGSPSMGSLPGLVLALPAAAATWFGFSVDSKSLVGSSMLSRISQIVTAVISALAIAVYFTSHHGHLWGNVSIVGITEPVWAYLFLASAFNLAYTAYRFALKVRIYHGLLRKEDGLGLKAR
ncbi:hypothetical protein FB565_003161 [Actinoplanes lutulentus]|uniref:hypothetical protein n=1 Tax=Actinoplanes lutulentus TaxID=1287878 RepID=UPI0011B93F45|nr:hypothetical protein [Actinoplanes lutulentus]MBB2943448.1 hypothetical protein [Actinoplanes lutulentus]